MTAHVAFWFRSVFTCYIAQLLEVGVQDFGHLKGCENLYMGSLTIIFVDALINKKCQCEVLRPSKSSGDTSSAVSLPNQFTGQS